MAPSSKPAVYRVHQRQPDALTAKHNRTNAVHATGYGKGVIGAADPDWAGLAGLLVKAWSDFVRAEPRGG